MTRVAAIQLATGPDRAANEAAIATAVTGAAAGGATLALLPEAANLLLPDNRAYPAACETEDRDSTVALLADLARRHGIWLHGGSLLLRCADRADRVWNRTLILDPMGRIVARYDKLHCFDVALGGAHDFRESDAVRPGEGPPVVVAAAGLRLGLSICYDLRFPALFTALAQAGADTLAVPASFSPVTGPLHWRALLRARAIETGCHVIAPAQCGAGGGTGTWGHSLIVDPMGRVLAEAGDDPTILWADLDPAATQAARSALPCLSQTRPLLPVRSC